jgi:predicted nucleic acid-binding protein
VRSALDTNILSGLFVRDSRQTLIESHLWRCQQEGPLLISPIVFAELLARPGMSEPLLLSFLAQTGIETIYTMEPHVWRLAGSRFAQHTHRRRRSIREGPRRLIADFVIGAHALVYADRLLTFDATVYQQDFPELRLYPNILA